MKPALAQNVGVDIAKDTLDVANLPAGESFRVANDPGGHRALIKRLGRFEISRIVFEATGAYHRLFERALAEAGLPFVKVNPRRARRFAEATGKLAKTDRCDALMLTRMGAALELEPCLPASKIAQSMKELVSARDALVKDRVAALNRKAVALDPLIKRQLAQRLRQIDRQIQAIDNRLRTLRGSDPDLTLRVDILTSIPGFAEPTANTLVPRRPSSGASTIPRPVASSVSPPSPATAARPIADDPSAADAREPDAPSICQPSAPSASTLNSRPNTRP